MKRILCYGDSNTWGHNPEPCGEQFRYRDHERWTGILQELVGTKAKILEEGLCGRTIMFDDPVAPDRNGRQFLNCCIQSQQPLDLVIIMLGTNDIRHIFTPSIKEIGMGMQNLVRMVKDQEAYWVGKVPEVLVLAPPPIRDEIKDSEFYGIYDEESVRKSKMLGQTYRDIFAGISGVTVIDAGEVAEVSTADCIHLSLKGHRELAEAVYEQVKKILEM